MSYLQAPIARTNDLAVGSLIFGILWIFGLGSMLAVILGHLGLRQCRRYGQRGDGLAIAGLILGYLGLAPVAALILIALVGAIAA